MSDGEYKYTRRHVLALRRMLEDQRDALDDLGEVARMSGVNDAIEIVDAWLTSMRRNRGQLTRAAIELMQSGMTPAAAAATIGVNVQTVSSLASYLRKRGVAIPKFTAGPKSRPIDEVAA